MRAQAARSEPEPGQQRAERDADGDEKQQKRLSAASTSMTRSASFGDKLKSAQNSLDRRARSRPLASAARDDLKATSAFNLDRDRDTAAAATCRGGLSLSGP